MKSRARIACNRLARAMTLVASMACGSAWSQCGPLGSAAEYPLYAASNLSLGSSTVSNGTSSFAVSGSGRAVNENTGVRLDPSPAPTFPALSPSSLPANGSNTDSTATSQSAGTLRKISVNSTTTFAAGTYNISVLQLSNNATVKLAPGNYNIGELTMGNGASIVVSPSGVVRINIGSKFDAGSTVNLNAGGTPSNLQMFFYPNANGKASNDLKAALLVYAPSSSNNLQFGDTSSITGAVIGSNIVAGKSNAFAYSPATQSSLSAVSTCGTTVALVDHYELSLPTGSLACLATTVTVTACASSSSPCGTVYTGASGETATLSTSAGTLSSTTVKFDNSGVATTTLTHAAAADGTPVTVTLSGESTAATNPRQCCPNGSKCSAGNSCSTTFNTAGFVISSTTSGSAATIPSQTAGTASASYYLRAVQTSTTTGACTSALTGASTVNWAARCNNPASCSAGNLMSIDGGKSSAIASNPSTGALSYSPVQMTFDANGNAPFTFTYADVGQVTLHVTKGTSGSLLSALSGASNAFVVKPAGFAVSNIKQSASPFLVNPAAAGAAGAKFVKAGESFTATVTAQTSGGAATPNFGKESPAEDVLLTPTLTQPPGGKAGALANGMLAGGSFDNGAATATTLAYSEVGIVTLTPGVADGNYLGAGSISGSASANVGRFVPARFALSSPAVTNRSSLTCASAPDFTYLGENFQLVFTLTAQSVSGSTTANYAGSFAKLDPTSAADWNLAGLGGATSFSTASGRLSLGTATGSFSNGVAKDVKLIANASRASTPDGPFPNAGFGVAPVDSDGVAMAAHDMASTSGGASDHTLVGTVPLRFGRLRVSNAAGPADRALKLPVAAQYWNTTFWDTNTLDSCTSVPVGAMNFGNLMRTITAADTAAIGDIVLSGGLGSLTLKAPAAGHYGTYDVALSLGSKATDESCLQAWTPGVGDAATSGASLAFLRGAWCGSSLDKDPSARATFGQHSTQQNHIYRRENY